MRCISLLILAAPFLIQCSSAAKPQPQGEAIRIQLKGTPGTATETRYYSHAHVKTYSDSQILRDRQEIVDFTTLTKVKSFDPKEEITSFTVSTIKKDGTVALHDLAFPEKFEEIDYKVRTNGVVVKAGDHPPQSLFFVPSLPVPKEEVRVGDTWGMEHTWYSSRDAIPLKLQVAGILKDMVPCAGKMCADIEVSGSVKLVNPPTADAARFDTRVWGRLLYSLDRGDIIWSEMRSQEEMNLGPEKFTVLSCMTSETKIKDLKLKLECIPAVTPVVSVPKNI